jgi:hypothetical protein
MSVRAPWQQSKADNQIVDIMMRYSDIELQQAAEALAPRLHQDAGALLDQARLKLCQASSSGTCAVGFQPQACRR